MRLVMKFGGTSVGNEQAIARVVDILKTHRERGDDIAVVVSAMTGVTDQLIATAEEVVASLESPPIETLIQSLRSRHMKVLSAVAPNWREEVGIYIDDRLEKLKHILTAIYTLRELTPRSRDYIVSFGERLSAPIVSSALKQAGIDSVVLDGCQAGIVTNSCHGAAVALPESYTHIKSRIAPLLPDSIPVIMGYMGCSEQGIVTTLGRSGSDYTGSIIGAGINADEIWIWTDVDGVMTTDPRMIPTARVIPTISFLEMMELSYFGAKVLHPKSIEPAMMEDIPVRVKNTFHADAPGTAVVRIAHREKRVVKAISIIRKVALLTIGGAQMAGRPGVAKAIFSSLADREVNVMLISQGSSEANITLVIDEDHLTDAIEALTEIKKQGYVREITFDKDIVVIAVVGAGMAGTPGTSGRIFSALGREGVNVMMITQGSSEVNVSFVVKEGDSQRAVQVLHDEYHLSEGCDE
ncbi:aspartate kinase [Methanocalculus sp. MSAO_Arc2]|uniref:aspartate kinase n=1 Tax=Methanocalculus sp. MSAO_Arc2 TaxID=2293855 RepID=UPI00321705AC